jgi:hypothetical protein
MLQRRSFVSGGLTAVAAAALATLAPHARAQRPVQPIARPPGQRLAGALVAGRFDASGATDTGASPGVYVVVAVDTRADLLQLRDEDGRTGSVHVNEHTFDLDSLKPGDEVEVDFAVPEPGSKVLQAGGIWKLQR